MHNLEHLETITAKLIQQRITAFVAFLNEESIMKLYKIRSQRMTQIYASTHEFLATIESIKKAVIINRRTNFTFTWILRKIYQ